jgi:hypothetical protein
MKSLQGVLTGMPLVSGVLFGLEYGPLCRAAGLFRGAPSGVLLGLAQGVAAAGAVSAMMGARPRVMTLAGVVTGHALLGALVGFLGAALERRDRFVSPHFLTWLKRQDDEREATDHGVQEPIQLARHPARRRLADPISQSDVPAVRAA